VEAGLCESGRDVVGELSEQIAVLKNAVDALTSERERERAGLRSVRAQLEATIRQAATKSTCADHLQDELERSGDEANVRQKPVMWAKGVQVYHDERQKAQTLTGRSSSRFCLHIYLNRHYAL
jgi:hypothetical protein